MTKYNPKGTVYFGIPRERVFIPRFVDNRDYILSYHQELDRTAGMFMAEGHRVDRNRDRIVKKFLESDAEWLCFLDSDMDHPVAVAERLTRFGKPIVGGLYFHRGETHEPFFFKEADPAEDQYGRTIDRWSPMRDLVYKWLIDHQVPMRDGAITMEPTLYDPLIECDAVATGSMVIHREVLEAMEPPWFEYEEGGNSEDLVWCKHAKDDLGYKIYGDLSTISGHYNWVAMGQAQFRLRFEQRGIQLSALSQDEAKEWMQEFAEMDEETAGALVEERPGHPTGDLFKEKFGDDTPVTDLTEEQVKEFYEAEDTGKTYIGELMIWNSTTGFEALKTRLTGIRGKHVIDLGAGIGSMAIQFAIQNCNIIAIEPNKVLRDFIDFRVKKMNDIITTAVGFIDLRAEWIGQLGADSIDVITCVDVFEHMPPDVLEENLQECYRVLKPGGRLIYHNNFAQQDIFPMHYDYSQKWDGLTRAIGFRFLTDMELVKIQ